MTAWPPEGARLRDYLRAGLDRTGTPARLEGPDDRYALASLLTHARLPGAPSDYADKAVLLLTQRQTAAAAALVALDGLARRIVLAPPDFHLDHLDAVTAMAGLDLVLSDGPVRAETALPVVQMIDPAAAPSWREPERVCPTEWALFTSGTTGAPKLAAHTLEGLTGAIRSAPPSREALTWATFYDIRRYGGLQILLRALLGGAHLAVTGPDEPVGDYLARLGRLGVTHLTGTPSHWRRALMSAQMADISPGYVRLSGEIADQAVLDRLAQTFPAARIGHAYASTEAGVGFEVTDGREGFPLAFLDRPDSPVQMKIVDGVLHVRSNRAASAYLGETAPVLTDADGYVDTDDMIEVRGDRCHFAGRRAGLINVGGLKIHPEEVEAVINRHPDVDLARVHARRSPITGALVAAEVVLKPQGLAREPKALRSEILDLCRDALSPAKTPASLAFVETLPLTAGGKLERRRA